MFTSPVFWTGFFTLVASLTAIYLKDYLERKKEHVRSKKQKAIEAYSLADQLIYVNNANSMICSKLLEDPDYNYEYILKTYPNTIHEDLNKLEILIVENFFDLNDHYLELNNIVIKEASKLLTIISNPKSNNIDKNLFEQNTKEYIGLVINQSKKLRKMLIDQYINVTLPPVNIYNILDSFKNKITIFFSKSS